MVMVLYHYKRGHSRYVTKKHHRRLSDPFLGAKTINGEQPHRWNKNTANHWESQGSELESQRAYCCLRGYLDTTL